MMNPRKIRTGDILMVSGNWFLARAIQFVTKSKWNHAGIFVWLEGELFVVEAEKEGLQLARWDGEKYQSGQATDRELVIMSPRRGLLHYSTAQFMMPYVGSRGYDFGSLLWYQVIYNLTGKWKGKKDMMAAKRFYCSEWVAYVYNHFLGLYPDWWQISPRELFENHLDEFVVTSATLLNP
jgi:hypothetical protein